MTNNEGKFDARARAVAALDPEASERDVTAVADWLAAGHRLGVLGVRFQSLWAGNVAMVDAMIAGKEGVPLADLDDGPGLPRETLIERAREEWGNDDIGIDDDASVSRADTGAWVQAWVWVGYEEGEEVDMDAPAPGERLVLPSGVVELHPSDPAATVCGHCGRGWDDSVSTGWTPTPSGRCPFEYEHEHEHEDDAPPAASVVPTGDDH